MSLSKLLPVVCLLCAGLAACGSDSKSNTADDTASGSNNAASSDGHQAAQASQESADTAGSSDDITAQQGGVTGHVALRRPALGASQIIDAESLIEYAHVEPHNAERILTATEHINTSFDMFGCTAVFDGNLTQSLTGYTLDANLTYSSAACSRSRKISGSANLEAVFNANERAVSVTQDMNQTLANGDIVRITSQNANAATYQLTSSGYASAGNVLANVIVNEHRVRTTAEGNVVFDFSITTDPNAALNITNSFAADANSTVTQKVAQTRTIVSGTNTVVHNVAGYTAKHTFDNLSRLTKSCLCPTSGSLTEDVTYAGASGATYTRVYTFTGCGTASVNVTASTDPNVVVGTTQVTWDSCN